MIKNISCAFFFVFIHSHLNSQNISRTIYSLLNFHDYEIITNNNLNIQTSNISSIILYNDYYRKYFHDHKKIGFYGNSWNISSWHSHIGDKINYGLKTKVQFNEYRYQNIHDQKALSIQNHQNINSINSLIGFKKGEYVLGGGLHYMQFDNNMPLTINEFPTSDKQSFNDYFLDFLEPTFGDSLNVNVESLLQNPMIFSTFPIYKQYQMSILYNHSHQKHNSKIHYRNSSNIDNLQGNRSIEIQTEFNNRFIKTNLSNKLSSVQTSLCYFITDINLTFNNILPPNYEHPVIQDLDKLGYIKGTYNGGSMELIYTKNNYQLLLGLGSGTLSMSTELVTPVLGKKVILIPMPISHGVEGKITGESSSQRISMNYNKLMKNTKLNFLSSYTHGYYDLIIDGDAQLEFGLISVPIFNTIKYNVHFIDLQGSMIRKLGNVNIIFSCTQIIPIISNWKSATVESLESSTSNELPSTVPNETDDVNYKDHRGGRTYSINIQYNW